MKKLLSLLLALTLVFSVFALSSCNKDDSDDKNDSSNNNGNNNGNDNGNDNNGGNNNGTGNITAETLAGKTPEQLYELSQTKLAEATSYSINATQVITMVYGSEEMAINQTVISTVNGDNTYSKVYSDMGLMDMEVWYVDGMLYSSMGGTKVKAPMDKDAFMEEYMGTDASEETLLDIPTSWFSNVKFEKEDTKWVLNFVISGDKYNEMFDNIDLGGEIVGDVIYKLYFDDDGNIEKMVTIFDMSIEGVNAHCDSVSYITIGNVTVTPPADADSYTLTTLQ